MAGPIVVPNLPRSYMWNSIAQGSKFKTNQYSKIQVQIFDMWCVNVRKMFKMSKKNFCALSFFAKSSLVKWHPLKQTKSKNKQHFFNPIFHDTQLCFWSYRDFSSLKSKGL